jgi:hypothetical protein
VSVNPGRRRFQRWIFTEENPPNMPEYRGLFDETISRGAGNKETNGEFWRSRTACSLESSSNLITCRGGHRVRMIYHSHSSSLTTGSGHCRGQFRSQSLCKVADQPWFFPENQGDPSMQIHATRIDIFVIHKILQRARQSSSRWLIKSYNFVTFVRNRQPESGMSPPDYSPGMPSAGASPPC